MKSISTTSFTLIFHKFVIVLINNDFTTNTLLQPFAFCLESTLKILKKDIWSKDNQKIIFLKYCTLSG